MKNLTERQLKLFTFIVEHFVAFTRAPSSREMMAHMRIASTNGISDHLKAMEKKGYLTKEKGLSRAIQIDWDQARRLGLPYPTWNFPPLARVRQLNEIQDLQ